MKNIYFDNAATTMVAPEVTDSMLTFLSVNFGNPSSAHSFGKKPKVLLEEAREVLSFYLGAKPSEITFTGSGTEANNLAIKGLAFKSLNSGKKHIISSTIEHPAVYETLKFLRDFFGFRITFIKPGSKGYIDISEIESNITPDTLLISVMHSNNETGVIQDIRKLTEIAHCRNVLVHTDSVQSIGKTMFNVRELEVDFATLSAHKIYGPKGIGALYINENVKTESIIHGGQQERGKRSGTENIPAVAGFKKAVELLQEKYYDDFEIYSELKKVMKRQLNENFGNKIIINTPENSLPNIINVSFIPEKVNIDPEIFLILLDTKGVAVSGGSACHSGTVSPSKVIQELGADKKTALMTLRISFGRYNTSEEVYEFIKILKNIIK